MEKNGGRPKKETTGFEDKKTTGYKNKKPNNNVNENVNVNENNNDNVNDSCVDGLHKVIDFYNNNIGSLTTYGLEILEEYTKEFNAEVVIYAMQISVEANKRTIQYIKAILNNWHKEGVKNITDAKNKNFKKVNKKETKFEQRDYEDLDFLITNKDEE